MPKSAPRSPAGKPLVIVESPTKVRTLKRYLGEDYDVASSRGHVRDLPKSNLCVDVEHGFEPTYEVIPDKKAVVAELKRAAKRAGAVYLACDPDREGEAICWHLAALIDGGGPVYRITFNEITRAAVARALEHPSDIDLNLVDAQQARRVLDRLVGYQVSPILWKTVKSGLSAGRVQSVALRLVVEREQEREAFVPEEFWTVLAGLETASGEPLDAELAKLDGKKAKLGEWPAVRELLYEIQDGPWTVRSFEKRLHKRQPPPPYITSTLQQDASTRLGFDPKRTMRVAQQLYEGVELGGLGQVGLITYMRTDSVRISDEGLALARDWIGKNQPQRLPEAPQVYTKGKGAQDAHEAVRPTDPALEPEVVKPHLKPEQFRLYDLVWRRFLAGQMTPALFDRADARVVSGRAEFSAKGSILRDPGFLALYPDPGETKDVLLPALAEGDGLELGWLDGRQKFTQPPPRYRPASLVKELEKRGIGRPSTYAAIISTLQQRDYVRRDDNRSFFPTELGRLVTKLLVAGFPRVLKVEFTAELEEELDEIARGEKRWREVLAEFYKTFAIELERAEEELPRHRGENTLLTEPACPKCGGGLTIRFGRAGAFVGCSNYPACDFTSNFRRDSDGRVVLSDRAEENGGTRETDVPCPECGAPMVIRRGRKGEFLGCSRYPECRGTLDFERDSDGRVVPVKRAQGSVETEEVCEVCGRPMVVKRGRYGPFLACTGYPECKNTRRLGGGERASRPPAEKTDVPCPECGAPMVVRRGRKGEFLGCSKYPKCRGTLNFERDDDGNVVPKAPAKKKAPAKRRKK
jgi:DNA topoisomerase-1